MARKNSGPPCRDCGGPTNSATSKQCRKCFERENREMTEAELDALIAERRPTMPKEVSTRTEYPLQRRTVQVRSRKRKGQEE